MKSVQITFNIPEEILYSLNQNKDEFVGLLRLNSAIQLFKDKKLSSGRLQIWQESQNWNFGLNWENVKSL